MLTTMLLRLTITVNSVHVDNDSVGVQRSYKMRSDLYNVDDHLAKRNLERTQVWVDGQQVSHL